MLPSMNKKCTKCLEEKDLEAFGSQKRGLNGKRSVCKNCVTNYNKSYHKERWKSDPSYKEGASISSMEWAKNNPEKRAVIAKKRNLTARAKNPEKIKARQLVNQKVRFGRIPPAKDCLCDKCGNPAAHYHHYLGYSFEHRYDVIPVCLICHRLEDEAIS